MKFTLASVGLILFLLCPVQARPDIDSLMEKFEPYAEKSRQDWGTPGMAISVVVGDQMVYSKGFGVRELGGKDPVTPETVFQVGSISKSFTVTLMGLLVDEGKVHWTDPVIESFPSFQMYDPWVTRNATIEDTMSQRSGMAPYAGDLLAQLGESRETIIESLRYIKPITSFRSQFAYVNNIWLVAAKVIETNTGKTWEENLGQRIFQPLGMTHSSAGFEEFYAEANRATPHLRGATGPRPETKNDPFADWVYTYGPTGGVNSNVLDMARYAAMQLHGKPLLSQAALDHMHSPHVTIGGSTQTPATGPGNVAPASYCLGWLRQDRLPQPLLWHNGGTSGSKAVIGLIPDSDVAIVVLTNFSDSELPEALMYKFYDLYLDRPEQDYSSNFLKAHLAAQPTTPKRPTKAAPPMALNSYAGTYHQEVYGKLEVRVEGDGLRAILPPRLDMKLKPWNRDTFLLVDPRDPYGAPLFATFYPDEQGQVNSLKLDLLFESPGGMFLRAAPQKEVPKAGKLP